MKMESQTEKLSRSDKAQRPAQPAEPDAPVRVRPLDDNVVVRRDATLEISEGGVALPGCAQERPTFGMVLAVGPGLLLPSGKRAPVAVLPGERVLFWKLAGQTIELEGGVEVSIMREDELLAVLDE